MSSHSGSRPSGPRALPSRDKHVPVLAIPTSPLRINKVGRNTPKLALSINPTPTPPAGDDPDDEGGDYSYYGRPLAVPTARTDPDKDTLRPPASGEAEVGSLSMRDLHDVISGLGGARNRSFDAPDDRNTRTIHSPQGVSGFESVTTNGFGSQRSTPDLPDSNEKFSDDVLRIISRLGEGAGGAVYKVQDTRTNEFYARKTIPTHTTPARHLLAELRHLSGSVHENICEFHGAYISSSMGEVNVVMELCEGGSLEAIGKRVREIDGRTSEVLIGKLAEGILKGLDFLHTLRIIHRDIKPSNILLHLSGVVKIADFGVSGDLEDSMVVTFTGTSWYMAPERVNGKTYTVRADVWSTGLSLLELAMNKYPLPDDLDGIIPLMDYITRGPPIQLTDDSTVTWSDGAKDFMSLCLRVSPQDRPYPRDLLKHPWVVECASKVSSRLLGNWVRQIWGLPKEHKDKESRKGHSRPVSVAENSSKTSIDDNR